MTQRGNILQQRAQKAHDLQQALNTLRDNVRFTLQPSMLGLQRAADEELSDGAALIGVLPSAINADNAEDAADAAALEELLSFSQKVGEVFSEMTAPNAEAGMLNGDAVRGRIKQASRKLYDLTRREAVLEASPCLTIMLKDYPDIDAALNGIEKAGEAASNMLDKSDLATQLRQAAQESAAKR